MKPAIRNIAIIAHVDHGKTTLVDHMLKQSGTFRSNESVEDRVMDSMDLERERGITIAAKNASMIYDDVKINIVDTPGHSDFGGEVERIMSMVDGAILLVDASEGPLPQTRFVLKKAFDQKLQVIVCINKIDRSDARISEVLDEIFDLFIDLDATEEQADFPIVYAIGRDGIATLDPEVPGTDLKPLFEMILEKVPAPDMETEGGLQILAANLGYNDFVGRLSIGRIYRGEVSKGQDVVALQENGKQLKGRVSALYSFEGMKQVEVEKLYAGDIAVLAGFEDINIGDTIASVDVPEALPRIEVEEPTVGMMFAANTGPFAGKEGSQVTGRKISDRLQRELLTNVSIRVEDTDETETWKVSGRGELQLAVLIEQMRREGFELLVSKPQVIFKIENGEKLEPMEEATVDVPDEYVGVVTETLGIRKGVMTNMSNKGSGRARVVFKIPTRGLIGYRSEFLTETRGTGLLSTNFLGYESFKGEIVHRKNGSLISDRNGKATSYSLGNLEPRGRLFVSPGAGLYEGMIIGENAKENDLEVNATKEKKLTNVRASGTDDAVRLTPVKPMTLEEAMEWINDDELIEVTPETIRLRCRELVLHLRKRAEKSKKS